MNNTLFELYKIKLCSYTLTVWCYYCYGLTILYYSISMQRLFISLTLSKVTEDSRAHFGIGKIDYLLFSLELHNI